MAKRVLVMLAIAAVAAAMFAGCMSSRPCFNCEDTPTKAYRNTSTGENEYYCEKCSSSCDWCGKKHTTTVQYTTVAGRISFKCEDCYPHFINED